MKTRTWVSSGIAEKIDKRQQRLLDLVLAKIEHYYSNLYLSETCYAIPLTLSLLSRLCNRSNVVVMAAVRMLSNSIQEGEDMPKVYYARTKTVRNASHRPYQIFLR